MYVFRISRSNAQIHFLFNLLLTHGCRSHAGGPAAGGDGVRAPGGVGHRGVQGPAHGAVLHDGALHHGLTCSELQLTCSYRMPRSWSV